MFGQRVYFSFREQSPADKRSGFGGPCSVRGRCRCSFFFFFFSLVFISKWFHFRVLFEQYPGNLAFHTSAAVCHDSA